MPPRLWPHLNALCRMSCVVFTDCYDRFTERVRTRYPGVARKRKRGGQLMKIEKPIHLITDDGVTELPIISFSQEEAERIWGPDEDEERDDPEPEGRDVVRPDYDVYEN